MNKLRTVSVLIPVLLTGCSYGSQTEASAACTEWKARGAEYTQKLSFTECISSEHDGSCVAWHNRWTDIKGINRSCRHERDTRQFLGMENKEIKAKKYGKGKLPGEYKVTKRFKY